MAYIRMENQAGNGQQLRLVPGGEYRVASRTTLIMGIVICALAALIALQDWLGALMCMYIGIVFLLTALMLHGRQRIIEFDKAEKTISILGGQKADMTMFSFADVEKLRLEPEPRLGDGEQRTMAKKSSAKSMRRWHLDMYGYDGTCVGLERSVALADMANFGRLLAEYMGVTFENAVNGAVIRPESKHDVTAGQGEDGEYRAPQPSPYSRLVALQDGHEGLVTGWQWPFLWRMGGVFALMLVTVSLAVVASFMLWYMLVLGVSFAYLVILVIAAFFLQIAAVAMWRILFRNAFCVVENGRVRCGTKIFWRRRIAWDVALDEVRKVFVHMPVKGRVRLYCAVADGRLLQMMELTSGLSVVTAGDAFWLATWLRHRVEMQK